jgi:pimeloyl-ACP methyl ester carboxylesterase
VTATPANVLVLSPSAPAAGRAALTDALATLGPVLTPAWPLGRHDDVLDAPVREVLAALDAAGGEPAVVCGIAAGALVALRAVAAAPAAVRGLVLCTGARPLGTTVRSIHRGVAGLLPLHTLQRLGGHGPALVPILDPVRLLDYGDLAPQVRVPVLVPYGDHDRVNRRPSELLARTFPGGAAVALQGAGPGWPWREPGRLVALVRELRERR